MSHDPNNTNWSRSTTSYGRKMLLSQGWTPGTYLGAVDAPHAHLHTKASSSPIRISLKEDNLGLGAKRGSGQIEGQCTGLDVFQGLLGRLNGKSEVVLEKEKESRDNLKRAVYMEHRWGTLRFVSGGVLVGDRIKELAEGERLRLADRLPVSQPDEVSERQDEILEERARAKAKRRAKASKSQIELVLAETSSKNFIAVSAAEEDNQVTTILVPEELVDEKNDDSETNVERTNKSQKKAEKLQRKLDRMERREARRLRRIIKETPFIESTPPSEIIPSRSVNPPPTKRDSQLELTIPGPVIASPVITASPLVGRHAARQRYIRQKKMAMMDPKALNEVSHGKLRFVSHLIDAILILIPDLDGERMNTTTAPYLISG